MFFFLCIFGGKQGSGPDRGWSPIEWGDLLSVRMYILPPWLAQSPAGQASGPASQASGPASQASGPASQASGQASKASGPASQALGLASQAPGWTDKRTNSMLRQVEQGKGLADHLMPLGYLLFFFCYIWSTILSDSCNYLLRLLYRFNNKTGCWNILGTSKLMIKWIYLKKRKIPD